MIEENATGVDHVDWLSPSGVRFDLRLITLSVADLNHEDAFTERRNPPPFTNIVVRSSIYSVLYLYKRGHYGADGGFIGPSEACST